MYSAKFSIVVSVGLPRFVGRLLLLSINLYKPSTKSLTYCARQSEAFECTALAGSLMVAPQARELPQHEASNTEMGQKKSGEEEGGNRCRESETTKWPGPKSGTRPHEWSVASLMSRCCSAEASNSASRSQVGYGRHNMTVMHLPFWQQGTSATFPRVGRSYSDLEPHCRISKITFISLRMSEIEMQSMGHSMGRSINYNRRENLQMILQ